MLPRRVPIVFSVLLFVVATCPAAGQVDSLLATVPHGARLRLQLLDSTIVMGRVLSYEQQRVLLRTIIRTSISGGRLENRSVDLDSIAGAWIHSGTRWKRGSAYGAGLGVLGMLVLGSIVTSQADGSSCNVGCWTVALGFGAAVGALGGAFVGYQFAVWRPLAF